MWEVKVVQVGDWDWCESLQCLLNNYRACKTICKIFHSVLLWAIFILLRFVVNRRNVLLLQVHRPNTSVNMQAGKQSRAHPVSELFFELSAVSRIQLKTELVLLLLLLLLHHVRGESWTLRYLLDLWVPLGPFGTSWNFRYLLYL